MKLPEKEWFTIQEVANRWSCSVDDVLHFIQLLKLNPSFYLECVSCQIRIPNTVFGSFETAYKGSHTGLVSMLLCKEDFCTKLLSEKRPLKGDLKGSLLVAGPPVQYVAGRENNCEILLPINATPITFDDILITREELLRFETEASQKPIKLQETITIPPPNAFTDDIRKKPRFDTLAKILIEFENEFKKNQGRAPQYIEVLNHLRRLCKNRKNPYIQEVSEGSIYWINAQGKQQKTTIKQLQNRLTKIHAK